MIDERLPIIIAGAGPCGLVAALVLQNHGISFILVETTSRSKLCSNAGAGFDLAPTALNILLHRIGLSKRRADEMLSRYERWYIATVHGKLVRDEAAPDSSPEEHACAHPIMLRKALLDQLLQNATSKEADFLKLNASVDLYQEDMDHVKVTLTDGSILVGRALLGCDGIHSKVRKCMHQNKEDPLQHLGIICYWGKCSSKAFQQSNDVHKGDSKTFVWLLGTWKAPGSFFVRPLNGEHLWVLTLPSDSTPKYQTRRSSSVLSETYKMELFSTFVQSETAIDPVLESLVSRTPAADIFKANLFDRVNLDLPYSSPGKLVALLGDSAHPQCPYLGQGVNSAITDAYVLATKLADVSVEEAISFYDSEERREEMKNLIIKAREQGKLLNAKNWFECWMLRSFLRYAPISNAELKRYDVSNRTMVGRLDGVRVEVSQRNKTELLLLVAFAVAVIVAGLPIYYSS